MTVLTVHIGPTSFTATLESERAPRTTAAFLARLPFEGQLVQARWSGEAELLVPAVRASPAASANWRATTF